MNAIYVVAADLQNVLTPVAVTVASRKRMAIRQEIITRGKSI